MRGPALVGYPPSDLRWSGDSQELYFEWRMPGEDEAATWVVGRDGGAPRRLTDRGAALGAADRRHVGARLAGASWAAIAATSSSSTPSHASARHHAHDRHRERPSLGARRDARDLRAREQPVYRARSRRAGAGTVVQLTSRRLAAPSRDRPTASGSARRRRAEADRLGRAGSRAAQAARGARTGPRAAQVRTRRNGKPSPTRLCLPTKPMHFLWCATERRRGRRTCRGS